MNSKIEWTKTNIEYLTENYSKLPSKEIAEYLGSTTTAVYQKAYKLGLKGKPNSKDKIYALTGIEIDFLKANYSKGPKYCAKELNKSYSTIAKIAHRLNLKSIQSEVLEANSELLPQQKCCSKCLKEKELAYFSTHKQCKFGITSVCKACNKLARHQQYINSKEKTIKQSKEYYNENKKRVLNRMKDYYVENKENIVKRTTEYQNNRRKIDSLYKFKTDMRALIRGSFRRAKHKKNNKTSEILGCSIEYFKEYVESKFQVGMTWDNHSQHGWHIDHIIPISSAKTEAETIKLNHYTNFQPLWAEENLSKSNKIL